MFRLVLITCALLCCSCSKMPRYEFSGSTMGTYYRVQAFCAAPVAGLEARLDTTLAAVNAEMSTYLPDSALSQFNQAPVGDWVPVAADLADVVSAARKLSEMSTGAFDVTVGPLVNLWGFGPEEAGGIPEPAAIDAARERVGYHHLDVRLSPPALKKQAPVYVDLSAIAKGHGVDRLARVLLESGCESYLVDIGGEVRAGARKPDGQPWRIGVEVPDARQVGGVQRVVPLVEFAVATSGDYRNFLEAGDRRYSHTIDPRTGAPVRHELASVTVLAPTAMSADGLATLLNVLGPVAGLEFSEQHSVAALFIIRTESGFEERASRAFELHH